jgi:hypothetical protein
MLRMASAARATYLVLCQKNRILCPANTSSSLRSAASVTGCHRGRVFDLRVPAHPERLDRPNVNARISAT